MRFLLIFVLVSFHVGAVSWSELTPGETYTIKQSFQLPMEGRMSSFLDVMEGEKVTFGGTLPLNIPGFPMILYHFDYKNCPGMELSTEVAVVEPVQESGHVVKVGAQLDEHCVLKFYVNGRDWLTNSLFK